MDRRAVARAWNRGAAAPTVETSRLRTGGSLRARLEGLAPPRRAPADALRRAATRDVAFVRHEAGFTRFRLSALGLDRDGHGTHRRRAARPLDSPAPKRPRSKEEEDENSSVRAFVR